MNHLCRWDLTVEDLKKAKTPLSCPKGFISAIAISPDNHWLVASSHDKNAHLCRWELSAENPNKTRIVLPGHEDRVNAVAISYDSLRLVSGSEDKTARLWDLRSSEPSKSAVVLRGPKEPIKRVAISKDGRWVIALSSTVRLWPLRVDDLCKQAKRVVGRDLSERERQEYIPKELQ